MLRVEQHHDLLMKVARPRQFLQSTSAQRPSAPRSITAGVRPAPAPPCDESVSENSDENSDSSMNSSDLVPNGRESENDLFSSDISSSNSNDTNTVTNL